MMKRLFPFALCGALAACGGTAASTSELAANAPTYDKLALAQSDADMTEPAAAQNPNDVTQQDETTQPCHPHLFDRSHEIVSRVNRHFFKHLRHVEELIRKDPTLKRTGTATWENVKDGVDRYVVQGRTDAVNPDRIGTKCAARYALTVGPGSPKRHLPRFRLVHSFHRGGP